jgi:hypothetical protein
MVLVLAGFFLAACTEDPAKNEVAASKPATKEEPRSEPKEEPMQNTQQTTPKQIVSNGQDFAVFSFNARHYVVGSQQSIESFSEHGHLPYARTILGSGPSGETVVYEIDKKNPEHVERLVDTYAETPFLIDSRGDEYSVYKLGGRIYVVGSARSKASFEEHGHLPYTKTILGAGPSGETVVFEVNKKDEAYVQRLIDIFKG